MQRRQEVERLPLEVMYSINLMLEPTDLVQLAKSCRTANQFVNYQLHLSSPNIRAFWARSLIKIGLASSLATDFALATDSTNSSVVTDYRRLYQIVRITPKAHRNLFRLWELACLSGSANAVQHAIQYWGLTAANTGYYGNALLNTAFSGSVDAMRAAYAIDPVGLKLGVVATRGTATNLAAESGSIPALQLAYEEYKIPTAIGFFGDHIPMHSAARSGSLPMMLYVARNWKERIGLRVDNWKIYDGINETILTYAIKSKSLDAIDYAIELTRYPSLDPGIDGYFYSAYRTALEGSSPDVMRRLFEARPIDRQKALTLAICYGSTTAMMFAISQLNAVITSADLLAIEEYVSVNPHDIRASNNLRLTCGLVGLDPSTSPMLANAHPEVYNIINQPREEIRESSEYKEWTAPFRFKEHKTHPLIELYKPLLNRQIKSSLGGGVLFAAIGTALLFTAPYILIPIIVVYGVASLLLSVSAYLKLKKSSLDRQISEILTPIPRPETNNPAEKVESSYARIAPFIAINPKVAKVSDALPPQADSKREAQPPIVETIVASPRSASSVYRR